MRIKTTGFCNVEVSLVLMLTVMRVNVGAGNGNPLQYSCLENLMDRRTWRATVHGVAKSCTRLKQLSTHTVDFRENRRE